MWRGVENESSLSTRSNAAEKNKVSNNTGHFFRYQQPLIDVAFITS